MRPAALVAGRMVRIYTALFAALFLLGWFEPFVVFWSSAVVRSTDAVVLLLFGTPPLLLLLVPMWLVALAVVALQRAGVRRFLALSGLLFLGFWLHLVAALEAMVAPRGAAIGAWVAIAALLLVGRPVLDHTRRASALGLAVRVFAILALAGLPGAAVMMNRGDGPERPDPRARLLGAFRDVADVVVLGPGGPIAVLLPQEDAIRRIDPETGRIEATLEVGGGLWLTRGAFHPTSGRLFVAGEQRGPLAEETLAVIDPGIPALERRLATPGCHHVSALRLHPPELLALCRGGGRIYAFDTGTLELLREGSLIPGPYFSGWDLGGAGESLAVTTTMLPYLFRFAETADSRGTWAHHRLPSVALPLATDHRKGLVFAGLPLQRSVAVFENGVAEPARMLPTAGPSRALAFEPASGRLFAASYFRGDVEALDAATGDRLDGWRVGPLVKALALDPDGSRLYSVSWSGVHRIDLGRGGLALGGGTVELRRR